MGINITLLTTIKEVVNEAISKAGFDRTRTGQVVGVNSISNTYSIRIDGITYPNVPCLGNGKLTSGAIVKVYIPCNQPSQMYVVASGSNISYPISIDNGGTGASSLTDAKGNLGITTVETNLTNVTTRVGTLETKTEHIVNSPTILWENSNPTGQFVAQTITLSTVPDYDYLIFYARLDNTHNQFVPINIVPENYNCRLMCIDVGNPVARAMREVTINWTTGAIAFTQGYYANPSGNSWLQSDIYLIPIRIEGIKVT